MDRKRLVNPFTSNVAGPSALTCFAGATVGYLLVPPMTVAVLGRGL